MRIILSIFLFLPLVSCGLFNKTQPYSVEECSLLASCGGNTQCNEGRVCIKDLCGDKAICVQQEKACERVCGKSDCAILESDPAQLACN